MLIVAAILAAIAPGMALAQPAQSKLSLYKTASSAACGDDQPVWVDPKTKTYYRKGDSLYGKTSAGGYNCRRQAEAAGYHASNAR
ncbi:MAG TPA: hypothetical protein VEI03_24075 [Stellaceae bacterium]|nr:hypothetical protein [Stellaceae bacterium]